MKVLITLFFNSELGGLHDNIRAVALEAKKRDHEVYVGCRGGLFFDQLSTDGINMIEIDDADVNQSVQNIVEAAGTDFDIIHANPGISREIAIQLHDEYDIPVVYHVHGGWVNAVETYVEKLDSIFAVSESVKQKVVERTGGNAHKVHVIPNYSDYVYEADVRKEKQHTRTISLITRLETDKTNIIEEAEKLAPYLNETDQTINFNVIGEGSLREKFITHLNHEIQNEKVKINDIGWISDKNELKTYMQNSDIIIGPGRVAIDAFTLRIPVIVVGSGNYHGLIDEKNWQHFAGANFGGYGSRQSEEGNIVGDLDSLLTDEEVYKRTVDIGSRVVDLFFNKEKTLEKMFGIYEIVSRG
ncbi:glycosyltransferase family 4 protein [Corticicoccus populi]|uniref:Glycosyltransferase family 4 protein n=1 Tax=Corticicoccus populi TaxID=1812821 RepID=A0ABW5WVU7_9STAP